MSVRTDSLVAQSRTLKLACGLFPRSERGKLALTGSEAKAFLTGQVTNDIIGLTEGTGCYAAAGTEALSEALMGGGALPVSEEAVEIARVERGRPRYGAELDDNTIPQEAGLNERAVSFTKGCYVGQETVARLFYRGKPNRHLRGLRLSAPASSGDELTLGDRVVGHLGSVAVSPSLGPIALALVRREAEPGDSVQVGD